MLFIVYFWGFGEHLACLLRNRIGMMPRCEAGLEYSMAILEGFGRFFFWGGLFFLGVIRLIGWKDVELCFDLDLFSERELVVLQ
jgi:hypothetical protein